MAVGNHRGRARTNPRDPQAMGLCDRCGFWFDLGSLRRQFQWSGAQLMDIGFLVCEGCQDIPQEQYRVLILPPDPVPVTNPRPDSTVTPVYFIGGNPPTTPGNQGFSQYVLGAATPGNFPSTKAAMLAAVAQISGVPTPAVYTDRSLTITPANTTLTVMPAAARSWLLLYNPASPQAQFSLATAVWGVTTNLTVGPGEAWFCASVQGNGAPWGGAITVIGLTPGVPFWAFEAN